MYIAAMNPTTPTTSPIGKTMPQMLRGGGTGAEIGASTAILPPPVSGAGSRGGGTNGRVVTRTTLTTTSVGLPAGLLGDPVRLGEKLVEFLLEGQMGEPPRHRLLDEQAEQPAIRA